MSVGVSIVIPAFKEGNNISPVLKTTREALTQGINQGIFKKKSKIVVVVNGIKEDNTGTIEVVREALKGFKNSYIAKLNNKGKALALKHGIEHSINGLVLLLDADLIGLTPEHIFDLFLPAIEAPQKNKVAVIGLFYRGRGKTDFAHRFFPNTTGIRVGSTKLLRRAFQEIPNIKSKGFAIEPLITGYLHSAEVEIKEVKLEGVSQVIKEEKIGVLQGFFERIRMYLEMVFWGYIPIFFRWFRRKTGLEPREI